MRLSPHEIRKAETEMADDLTFPMQPKKPSNDISRGEIQNDWTKSPTRTLANGMNISERLKAAHAAITKANAAKQS